MRLPETYSCVFLITSLRWKVPDACRAPLPEGSRRGVRFSPPPRRCRRPGRIHLCLPRRCGPLQLTTKEYDHKTPMHTSSEKYPSDIEVWLSPTACLVSPLCLVHGLLWSPLACCPRLLARLQPRASAPPASLPRPFSISAPAVVHNCRRACSHILLQPHRLGPLLPRRLVPRHLPLVHHRLRLRGRPCGLRRRPRPLAPLRGGGALLCRQGDAGGPRRARRRLVRRDEHASDWQCAPPDLLAGWLFLIALLTWVTREDRAALDDGSSDVTSTPLIGSALPCLLAAALDVRRIPSRRSSPLLLLERHHEGIRSQNTDQTPAPRRVSAWPACHHN